MVDPGGGGPFLDGRGTPSLGAVKREKARETGREGASERERERERPRKQRPFA